MYRNVAYVKGAADHGIDRGGDAVMLSQCAGMGTKLDS